MNPVKKGGVPSQPVADGLCPSGRGVRPQQRLTLNILLSFAQFEREVIGERTRIFIPLTQRRRNGRPRIVAPETATHFQSRTQDPHILRALGRAWAWRRKLESGEAATLVDIARVEKISDRFVGRIIRLAYLSPDLLERLVISRDPPSVSVNDLIKATYLPWAEQMGRVYDFKNSR